MSDPAIDLLVAHGYKYNAEAGSWSKEGEKPAPMQEPAAWAVHYNGPIPLFTKTKAEAEAWGGSYILPLYTTPPATQRQWVGLTDEEAQWIYDNGRTPSGMMEMVEAKLKEKNT